jgi:hypothetical protein
VVLLSGGVRRGACQSQVGSGCTPIRRTGSSIGLFNRRRSFRCDRVEVAGSILFRVEGHEFFLDCVSPFDFIDLVEIQSKVFECIRAIAPDRDEYAEVRCVADTGCGPGDRCGHGVLRFLGTNSR